MKGGCWLQPVNHLVVGEAENKLVDHPVYSNCATHELQLRVRRVIENKVIAVKISECYSSDSSCHLQDSQSNTICPEQGT